MVAAPLEGLRCEGEHRVAAAGQFGAKWFSVEHRHPQVVKVPQVLTGSHHPDRAACSFDVKRPVARGRHPRGISRLSWLDHQEQRRQEARTRPRRPASPEHYRRPSTTRK